MLYYINRHQTCHGSTVAAVASDRKNSWRAIDGQILAGASEMPVSHGDSGFGRKVRARA